MNAVASSTPATTTRPGPRLPSLDDLAARGPFVAPGMREAQRRDATMTRELRVDVARPEKDACGRVLYVATAPIVARLEDSRGVVLAAHAAPTTSGSLAERGPVCVRRGETIRVAYEGAAGVEITVRWVAWTSE